MIFNKSKLLIIDNKLKLYFGVGGEKSYAYELFYMFKNEQFVFILFFYLNFVHFSY